MARTEPIEESIGTTEGAPAPSWEKTLALLENEPNRIWVATVREDGRPHLMPVGGVWVDGAMYFNTGATTRKGRNLARDPRVTVSITLTDIDVVIEGKAEKVTDDAILHKVAGAFGAQGWGPDVRDGAFWSEIRAPAAPPPPWDVWAVVPETIFGLPTVGHLAGAARWRF
jgi:Pyridoxamine 5'-phosphate oxidase